MKDPHGFPPRSPNLNPIEMIWGYMDDMVKKHAPKYTHELVTVIREVW